MKQILIITFILTVLFIAMFALSANAEDIHAEGGIYFEWLPSKIDKDQDGIYDVDKNGDDIVTYIWAYGQRFGSTVLSIQGVMFEDSYMCLKYEGEERPCTYSDYRLIRMSLKNFQSDPTVIIIPDWVFNTSY